MRRPVVIIFARAPRLGAVKRRLAAGIGARGALRIEAPLAPEFAALLTQLAARSAMHAISPASP